jgi:hypothetical protein
MVTVTGLTGVGAAAQFFSPILIKPEWTLGGNSDHTSLISTRAAFSAWVVFHKYNRRWSIELTESRSMIPTSGAWRRSVLTVAMLPAQPSRRWR